jgi:hypothetical protein
MRLEVGMGGGVDGGGMRDFESWADGLLLGAVKKGGWGKSNFFVFFHDFLKRNSRFIFY